MVLSADWLDLCLCVSGWEPFIEPWPCFLSWQQQAAGRLHPPRLKMGIRAKQRLDVNITSVLLGEWRLERAALHVNLSVALGAGFQFHCWTCPTSQKGWTCLYLVLPEQYNTTKSSWIADYCNEEEQNPPSPPPLPWMGSSVDPPSVGQSEFQLHTVPQTNHWVVKNFFTKTCKRIKRSEQITE